MSHPRIRAAIINAIQDACDEPDSITWFDGRPAIIDEAALPAVAVYLSDAEYTGDEIDVDIWEARLHVEVILGAAATDTELDEWMESLVYPALVSIPALRGVVQAMTPQGYDYQRDADADLWTSADLRYSITYER